MALVNGGFLHYTNMKKFLKNLLRNQWLDFEIIFQESGFDISLILAVIAFVSPRASKIFGPLSSVWVFM